MRSKYGVDACNLGVSREGKKKGELAIIHSNNKQIILAAVNLIIIHHRP